MKLIRSSTYWESIQILQDSNGEYYELTQNSLGLYMLDGPLEEDALPKDGEYPEAYFRESGYGPSEEVSKKLSDLPQIPIR